MSVYYTGRKPTEPPKGYITIRGSGSDWTILVWYILTLCGWYLVMAWMIGF